VTITLYDPVTGDVEPLDYNVCDEITATGVFLWDTDNLTDQPALLTGYQEFAYAMTDGITTSGGIIAMFDPADSAKLDTIITQTTAEFQADAVWDALIADHDVTGSFGEFVVRRLLTVAKFFSLRT
jgi:hypothetical protein